MYMRSYCRHTALNGMVEPEALVLDVAIGAMTTSKNTAPGGFITGSLVK